MRFTDRRLEALWQQTTYSHFRLTDCVVLCGCSSSSWRLAISTLADAGGSHAAMQGLALDLHRRYSEAEARVQLAQDYPMESADVSMWV